MSNNSYQERVGRLVRSARRLNQQAVRHDKAGKLFPAQVERNSRDDLMLKARAMSLLSMSIDMKQLAIQGGAEQSTDIRDVLANIADLVCGIDHQKNQLPAEHKKSMTHLIDTAHGYVHALADKYGVVVYADQTQSIEAMEES